MSKKTCLIVDEKSSLKEISCLLLKHKRLEIIGTQSTIVDSLDFLLKSTRLDLLVLNLDLEGSVKLLGHLYSKRRDLQVIVHSDNLARRQVADELGVVVCLLRPFREELLHEAIETSLKYMQLGSNPTGFFIPTKVKGQATHVAFNEISHIESYANYVRLVLVDNSAYIVHRALKKVEHSLPASFARIHRQLIVNTSRIKSLNGDKIILVDNQEFKIGESYRAELISALNFLDD